MTSTPEPPSSSRTLRVLGRIGGWMRDAWLILGATLAMLVALEVAYRGQAGLKRALRSRGEPPAIRHPYADSSWYAAYSKEYDESFGLRWKPYVYFRRPPFTGAMINVDSAGHRRTVPTPVAARDTIRVFVFGGSTTWGTSLRDSSTIPSVLAKRLASTAKSGTTFEVTNFGESGYVFTQEVLELELQLRSGNIPDIVVFFDGINDVASVASSGQVGIPNNERNRAREFDMGRAIYGTETGVGSESKAAGVIAGAILQRVQFFRRLVQSLGRPITIDRPLEALAQDQVAMYANTARLVEALGRDFGFRAVYVWQPTLHTTRKQPTPWEQAMLKSTQSTAFGQRLTVMHRAIPAALTSVMRAQVNGRFVDESGLFEGETGPVFTDDIGHNTEAAIPTIVDGFLPAVAALVDSVPALRRARPPLQSSTP